jgi:hypothetical protein
LRKPVGARSRGGVPVLKVRNPDVRITLEMVNALRDEAPWPARAACRDRTSVPSQEEKGFSRRGSP